MHSYIVEVYIENNKYVAIYHLSYSTMEINCFCNETVQLTVVLTNKNAAVRNIRNRILVDLYKLVQLKYASLEWF